MTFPKYTNCRYLDALAKKVLVFDGAMGTSLQTQNLTAEHFVGSALNLNPPEPESEIKNLHRKTRNGADFFLTQPIYRPEDGRHSSKNTPPSTARWIGRCWPAACPSSA